MRLNAAYYRLRRKLGMAEISPDRLNRQEILHPETDPKAALEAEDEKRLRLFALCTAAGLLLAAAAAGLSRDKVLESVARPDYGEEAEQMTLHAEWGEVPLDVALTLEGRAYTAEEWEALKEEVWRQLRERALGENTDWDHISGNLDLKEETEFPGVTVSWESSKPEWIDYDGTLGEESAGKDGNQVVLTAVIQCGEETYAPQITATLRTAPHTVREQAERDLGSQLAKQAENREEADVALPTEYRGRPLRFILRNNTPPVLFVLAGLLAAFALWMLPEQRRREEEKKRREELETGYPELISTLTVLMSAGLTIRGAWERMVMNYRRTLLAGGRKSTLYEEMSLTLNSLGQGTMEEEAYVRFGQRCGLQPYLRLGSLLESNLKKGGRGLLPLLTAEAEAALDARLRDARKQGEEMSSKLLLPMLLLFSLILVILMVPAMLTF